jgi:tetratricopeptide (TPR) repeat protein
MFGHRLKLAAVALALTMLAGARVAGAQEPYGKYVVPPTPVTGEPPWKYKSDPKTDAAKIRAVHLYVEAIELVESARGDLAEADQDITRDPKNQKDAQKQLDQAAKRLASAREMLREATVLDATCADCWSLLGYTCSYSGDRDCAYQSYAKSLALNPNHFATHEYQAESYLKDGRIRDALAELEWLKARGYITTLETKNLTSAIERWSKENPDAAKNAASAPALKVTSSETAPPDSTSK